MNVRRWNKKYEDNDIKYKMKSIQKKKLYFSSVFICFVRQKQNE